MHTAEEDKTTVGEICRKLGITDVTFYRWEKKYGNLMPSEVRRLKQLEEENKKLEEDFTDATESKKCQENRRGDDISTVKRRMQK